MQCLALLAALFLSLSASQAVAEAREDNDKQAKLFAEKIQVAPNVYVEKQSQFVKWGDQPVPQGDYDPDGFDKTRIGTVTFSADLRVHIDTIDNKHSFPSYFQLVDAHSGAVLGKYSVPNTDHAVWYFAGNGSAYLNQEHSQLCGPRHTRKFQQKGKTLIEVAQPLVYVGTETYAETTTQLYETPNGGKVVATLAPETKVTVLGLAPGRTEFYGMALLVKTPFGLTGWHVVSPTDEGRLNVYQCN